MIHKNEIFSMGQTTPKQNFFFAEQGGPWEWLYGAKWVMGGGGGRGGGMIVCPSYTCVLTGSLHCTLFFGIIPFPVHGQNSPNV